ncbi:MAG: YncE family protein [Bradyrhizobium sp.]
MRNWLAVIVLLPAAITSGRAQDAIRPSPAAPPLKLEARIPLGNVRGRIDHMAVDLGRQRLFIAALGNNSLAVIDLKGRRLDRLIGGLPEPQGVGYDAPTDTVYVANAGDGSVRFFKGGDLAPLGRIELGGDADNVRVDSKARRIFVGYGEGGLAIIDAATRKRVASAPLKAHPESLVLDGNSGRIFVNVPNARAIDVVDRRSAKKIASWSTVGRRANFAMALDQARQNLLVAFRHPAELGVFSIANGSLVASIATCGDVDDVFVDSRRNRVYLSCGAGFIEVLTVEGTSYRRSARIATAAGARTSLFVPELDRLLVAVPARVAHPAGIWIFSPSP